jgi:hypothetical protein
MGGNGKGGNNRRNFHQKEKDRWGKEGKKKGGDNARSDKPKGSMAGRPKWVPPTVSAEPIPVPDCPYCGKPIRDLSLALTDRRSGEAVHFDCALGRLKENETLERGEAITYIGRGRFGVVRFANPNDPRGFTIKKIFEWEDSASMSLENRVEWRKALADRYSIT